uniref:Uncharacterized protein n=1 Tax=Acrobeloides nanus TaxID=290746 RepID=A0A914DGX2_9BILA
MLYLILAIFILLIKESDAAAVDQCCRRHQVPEICVNSLCNPTKPPDDFKVYEIFDHRNNCSSHLKKIAQCLSNGRNHTSCCSSEARDRDLNACFSLCEGEGLGSGVVWPKYQSCLAVNLPSMFTCFEKGYQNTPSPPQLITAVKVGPHMVELSWSPPTQNPNLAHKYEVICSESDQNMETEDDEIVEETRNTFITLTDLHPGTKYLAYIIAITRDGKRRSLASDIIHFQTSGVPPTIQAFKDPVQTPRTATSVILACRFQISGISHSKLHLEWQRKSGKGYEVINDPRFLLTSYVSSYGRPREFVTTLEIFHLQASDFTMYRCKIADEFGNAHADVQLKTSSMGAANSEPPDTPLGCCQYRGVESRCLAMCGASDNDAKKYVPRPSMPINCSGELAKVISCAMQGIDESPCCLKKKVPRTCMYLCDGSITPHSHMPFACLEHLESAQTCRANGLQKRPTAVDGLKATSSPGTDTVVLRWNQSERAEIYHVYWRKRPDQQWEVKSVVGTTKKISGADEVVVVAANAFGISQAAKLSLANAKWSRN